MRWMVTGAMRRTKRRARTRINYEQGQRVVCVWVPVSEGEVAREAEWALKGNRFAMLARESEVHQGFTWRVLFP